MSNLQPWKRQRTFNDPMIQESYQLIGHKAAVYSGKILPHHRIVTAGHDRMIWLWRLGDDDDAGGGGDGDPRHEACLSGHNNAILSLDDASQGTLLYSASADQTCALWDLVAGVRVKKMRGHLHQVNCITAWSDEHTALSVGNDAKLLGWDQRRHYPILTKQHSFPLLSVASHGTLMFTAGLDNLIYCWDSRNMKSSWLTLTGHEDSITGLALSPDKTALLSTAMDHTCRVWDIQAYSELKSRQSALLEGASHGTEQWLMRPCWHSEGRRVACGGADRTVTVWDAITQRLLYKIPGHSGCVTQVDWQNDWLLSVGVDKQVWLGRT